MLRNLNQLQRRWAMASAVLFVLSAVWTVWKFPTEGQFRANWEATSKMDLQNYSDVQKELTEHCNKYAEHRDPAVFSARYKTCWDNNRKFYEVAVRSKEERIKELKVEYDRQFNVVLPKKQVSTLLRGFSFWFFSTLALYLGWLFMVWRRNEFSLKWLNR
jgi:hypothetical protein